MKKILLLTTTLLMSWALAAQPRLSQREYYLGIHGGVSASTILFSPTVPNMTPLTKTALLGGNGGLVFRYTGHKCCGLQVELNYLQRGWKEVSENVDYTRRLHYLEVPFLTHIYFGRHNTRGFINLGPEVGYCLLDHSEGNCGTESIHQYAAIEKPFDWGIAGGVGLYVRSHRAGAYQLEARVRYSLGTIFSNRTGSYFSQSNPLDVSLNLAWMWEWRR